MSLLAAVRPDSWNFPLFIHVLGAMILVGGLLTGAAVLGYARGDTRLLRVGYWSLVALALPGYVVMRVGAEWVYAKGWDEVDPEPGWIGIGYMVSDIGALVLLVTLIVGGIGVRRLEDQQDSRLLKVTLWISILLLAAFVVAVWAMAGKPD
ncbi:MAG TPA: hypothetical protein VFR32_07865 [Gaiellaceae bacterium]|nr:hypothetical protein [Gaiellaceae bacterium]